MRALPLAAMALAASSATLGGASRDNPLRQSAVEIASLPLLYLAVRGLSRRLPPRATRLPLILAALIVALPLLQLIPLPSAVWLRLPGAGVKASVLRAAGLSPGVSPISLDPFATLGCLLALAPPMAMFLAALQTDISERRRLAGLWLFVAAFGLLLGAAQLASPRPGLFYPYQETNYGSLVGFFANRNHEAAMLVALIPFAALFASETRPSLGRAAARAFIALAIVGLGVVRSRAGVLLAGVALLVSVALVWVSSRRDHGFRGRLGILIVAAAAGVAAVAFFGLGPILIRFQAGAPAEVRFEAWPYVARAAMEHMPFGAGVGAFDRVFRQAEPLALLGPKFLNHAHNDFLEIWLETGLLGATLLVTFAWWFGCRAWRVWMGPQDREWGFARSASVAASLILAASLVDYPLRTEALATFFAFCCGALALEA
ncbi:MAG: O-antigen ligase family protein [Caulobacteraceae bacterium]